MNANEEDEIMRRVLQRRHDKEVFAQFFNVVQTLLRPPPPGPGGCDDGVYLRFASGASYSAASLGFKITSPKWTETLRAALDEILRAHPELEPEPKPESKLVEYAGLRIPVVDEPPTGPVEGQMWSQNNIVYIYSNGETQEVGPLPDEPEPT